MSAFYDAMKVAQKRAKGKSEHSSARLREILEILRNHDVRSGLTPQKAVDILQDLGPTFVKLGQIASTHPDMLPREYCEAFAALRAHVRPVDVETVKNQIERELGKPIDQLFQSFDDEALGSASIAQVHKAVMADGTTVAVKVQRPGIVDTVTNDLALMERLLSLYEFLSSEEDGMSFRRLVEELERTSREELDFTIEAGNLKRFYRNNESRKGITSPRCYEDYSTEAVLTMDFADGPRVGEADQLAKISAEGREKLAYLIADNYMAQIMDDGFFHADPHAGNILITGMDDASVLDDGANEPAGKGDSAVEAEKPHETGGASANGPDGKQDKLHSASDAASAKTDSGKDAVKGDADAKVEYGIEWIDFGMMGELSSQVRDAMQDIVKSLVKEDAYGLKRALLKIAKPTGPINHGALLSACDAVMSQYVNVDLQSFDTGALLTDLMNAMDDNGFEVDPTVVMLARGLVTLEGTINMISSSLNIMKVVMKYAESNIDLDGIRSHLQRMAGQAADSTQAMVQLPTKAVETLDMLQKNQIKLDTTLGLDKVSRSELSSTIDHFTLAVIAIGLFIGSCVLCLTSLEPRILGVPMLGMVGFVTGLGIAICDFVAMWRERKRRK